MSEMATAMAKATPGNTKTGVARKRKNYFVTYWHQVDIQPHIARMKYIVMCDDSTKDGLYHGHAFVYFNNQTAFNTVKKIFGHDCNISIPQKNSDCINYVKGITDKQNGKESRKTNIFEHGNKPMDNGVHNVIETIENYNTITEVMENEPETYCRFRNGLNDIFNNKQKSNRFIKAPEVIWTYGPTGTGKTLEAFNNGAEPVEYENGFFSDWGDSRCIVIEEMRGQIPYDKILQLLDQYHNYYKVNIKGGYKLIDLDKIYITSPYHPKDVYKRQVNKTDSINQLLRRITKIVYTGDKPEDEYVPNEDDF